MLFSLAVCTAWFSPSATYVNPAFFSHILKIFSLEPSKNNLSWDWSCMLKSGLILRGLRNAILSQREQCSQTRGKRVEVTRLIALLSHLLFKLLVTRFFHFFMLLYLFPKQIFYGSFSQRSEAINKNLWKSPRSSANTAEMTFSSNKELMHFDVENFNN